MGTGDEGAAAFDLVIEGALDRTTVPRWEAESSRSLRGPAAPALLRLDLGRVERMDSAGAAFCEVLRRRQERRGGRLVLSAASPPARDALSVFRVRVESAPGAPPAAGLFERIGGAAVGAWEGTVLSLALVADTLHYTGVGLFGRRDRVRGSAVVEQMVRIGLESLGIVGLISLLVGLTVALQSAYQLRQFGANIYIVDLVGVAMTREMGPLMTAILLAGRSGASIAAEISTMTITEEVDALTTMGVNPVRFLVVPRFLAITLTQPLLTVMADALGILGGFVIAVLYLQIGPQAFYDQLVNALVTKDILTGLVKSVSFAWIIVFVAAHRGFRVKGGAEGVGLATTASVVQAIFLVIVADAFFSLVFYFGG
ncbi:MAG: MlaE family lipid ABC transporter permease subunit [Deltaproteobacteria bacterium]|nr:MlaE family lipid ABC transporter permease subunit [Deltaproteobacteria bacterium]